jgi:type III secretory pathway component EscS
MKKSIEFFAELLWFISVLVVVFIILPIVAGILISLVA